jgi:PAS domain S-box-containing protein
MAKPVRILHLESNPAEAKRIAGTLRASGESADIIHVATHGDFIDALPATQFDLILSDNTTPFFSRLAPLQVTGAYARDIPFIFVGERPGEDAVVQAFLAGAKDYVFKDSLSRLGGAVRRALRTANRRTSRSLSESAPNDHELRQEIAERESVEAELRASEEKYRSLFGQVKDVVFMSSRDGHFLDLNRAGLDLYGYESKEELLKMNHATDLYVNPGDRAKFQEAVEREGYVKDYEIRLKKKNGQEIIVLETAMVVRDHHGSVVGYQGITHDITQRKQQELSLQRAKGELEQRVQERTAELADANATLKREIAERQRNAEALRESEERYRTLFEESRDAIYIADRTGEIVEMNPFALNLFGYGREELYGRNLKSLYVDPKDYTRFQEEIEEKSFVRDYDVRMKKKNGTVIDCLSTSAVRKTPQGRIIGYQGVIHDVTERKRAEAELRRSRQMLRRLSGQLQQVREEEKSRIAREIHDELGQLLTGFKLDLSWLGTRLTSLAASKKEGRNGLTEKVHHLLEKIGSMIKLNDRIIETVRRIARELRPPVLDYLGLLGTLEWQSQEFETRTGIRCKVSSNCPDSNELDQNKTIALFRIFQETLTNVARHAHATKVNVSLLEDSDAVVLRVEDNGKGIGESQLSDAGSLGLVGMRERAFLLGGDITISGAPGKGTTVRVRIPRKEGAP